MAGLAPAERRVVTIGIVNTSVFCNVLDVPGRNQDRDHATQTLKKYLESDFTLLLPLATVYETGNHIAHVADGRLRRNAAENFVIQVRLALKGKAPWTPTPLPDTQVMLSWLDEFPDSAMRAVSLADLTIIKEFERQCEFHRARRVFIWSYDSDLSAYDRKVKAKQR